MKFKGAAIATVVSMSLTGLATSAAMAQTLPTGSYEINNINVNQLTEVSKSVQSKKKSTGIYIVQLKSESGVAHQRSLEGASPALAEVSLRTAGNSYSAMSPAVQAHIAKMKIEQASVISELSGITVLHNYYHTFNGFAAALDAEQLAAVKANPEVVNVWEDELLELTTANTPAFLGLTGPNGQHTLGLKGDGVIVGIVDSGIWPENPSFADDGTYPGPPEKWVGECNSGTIGAEGDELVAPDEMGFECSNKLIGARYFGASFANVYDIQFEQGEFNSARDADGHGSHTAGTSAGNFVEEAELQGIGIGSLSGVAPRAHVAAYKVCWNSDYVSPLGVNERGCFGSDSQAAIDAAVADGVDVINYSISGSRTDNISPQTLAMLRAADAGVFVSVSAGNSGPEEGVVGTPAPWVMSVGASTYDGDSVTINDGLDVTVDGEASGTIASVGANFGSSWDEGFGGALTSVSNLTACEALPDGEDLSGRVALISRGGCSFTLKVANAENAGAVGVVVFNNQATPPFAMGSTPADGSPIIPSRMVSQVDGTELANNAVELETTVTFNGELVSSVTTQVGNVMAEFSSRGQNEAVADIIKPDITAPGVSVLAATSAMQLDYPGNNPLQGEDFAYLSGTSMSSPHIAGMAALLTQQFPEWGPSQKKSALMTTAYQDMLDYDGSVPTPFVFGSGHADVLAARTPGFTYNSVWTDYSAYLCGRGRDEIVLEFAGFSCAAFANAGFSFDATQLNYPSIAIANLVGSEVVVREVTDVTGADQSYDVSLDLPTGITATVLVPDGEGNFVPGTVMNVPADGSALYGLILEVGEGAVFEEWSFGSITFTNGELVNRSPIAMRPAPPLVIDVPERVTVSLSRRGNATFPVQYAYSGKTSMESQGLATPFGSAGTVFQDADQSFAFNEAGLGIHFIEVPEGSSLARFSLFDDLVELPDTDLDLILYRCIDFSCSTVTDSLNGGSDENIELVNPDAAFGNSGRDFYLMWVHGFDLGGDLNTSTEYTLVYWIADGQERNTRIRTSTRAREGLFNKVYITGRNLPFFSYMGTATFFDDEGNDQGTTVIEAIPQ